MILLFLCSAYAALVESLCELFDMDPNDEENGEINGPVEFIMCWKRRIDESAIFFNMLIETGFEVDKSFGHGMYIITKSLQNRIISKARREILKQKDIIP